MLEKIEKLEETKKKKAKVLKKSNLNIHSTVRDGILVYLNERKMDVERGIIEETTLLQDIKDFEGTSYLLDYGIYDVEIYQVDQDYAQNFVDYLRDRKVKTGKNKGERLSENTIYKPFSFIRKVFNYFFNDLKIIDYNPFDKVKRKPKIKESDKEYFTDEEMHYIKDKVELENIRFRTLITFMMDMGCRREEVLAIKYSDINRLRRTISINRAFVKSPVDGKYIIKKVKTKKSKREIVCTSYVLELIDNYRKFKETAGLVVTDDDYVFTAWDSLEIVDPDRYSKEFNLFLKKIGIQKKVPLKNLRQTNTSFFVSKNVNIKALQNRQGHESAETTLKFYARSNLNDDRKLVKVYEDEFYNKLGLNIADLYRIVSNRFSDNKKLTNILQTLTNEYIDNSNYDVQLERCQNYFIELFPIFNKILKIDSIIDDDEIDLIFEGFSPVYSSIKIECLEPEMKI